MTPLHSIQKDRGCTVGQGCEGETCTCKRMVRLVLEAVREPTREMQMHGIQWLPWGPSSPMHARNAFRAMIDTALKEVG